MSSSRELSNLEESSFEIKDLKPNRNYWVGMAIKTTKGISEIYRSIQFINITRCTKETCHENATCSHQDGLLNCTCKPGYSGNGSTCTVGCTKETCHVNATCRLQNGSVSCTCKPGYSGNGSICTEDEISPPTKAPRGDDDGGVSTPVIIFIVLFVCFLVIGAIIGLMIFKRRRKSNDAESATIIRVTNAAVANLGILFPEAEQSSPPVNVSTPIKKIPLDDVFEENEDGEIDSEYLTVLDEWELKRDRVLITNKKLGVGQFGIVKKGTYRTIVDGEENDEPVAVKLLKDKATEIDRSDLLTELRILKFVNTKPHQNILKLIGACTSEAPLMVITEYCLNGNLKELLKSFKSFLNGDLLPDPKSELRLTHEQLLKIAVDVCCGMEHLASMKFVHRDLAARNILIGESWIAKIADFGLSRETSSAGEYIKTHRNLLPVKWTAIEALVEGKFSTASDVWSFGVLLWEISNIGGEPYQGISPYDIMSHVGSGGRLQKPERCSPYLYEIMKECWETKPEKRPSFTKLHEKLSGMLQQSEKLYINVGFMDDVTKKDGVYERYTSA